MIAVKAFVSCVLADMDVAYLQLLLFVWHSFTVETRKTLLIQCAHSVMKAAQAKE